MPSTIDQNFNGVGRCVTDDVNATISNLLVDPVTGRLLVTIYYDTSNDLILSSKIDENYEGVAKAVSNDANATILPLKVHPTNNGLLIDIA